MSAPGAAMELHLDNIRAVEASAGTGKTFTIATLYLRLILERDLKVDEIVVATFTRAAAAELSERLRGRLVVADTLLRESDPAVQHDGEAGDRSETRKAIARARDSGIALEDLQRRAHEARLAIDTAFIGTLHGFCHRVLAEFGFDTGQALAPPELIEAIRDLEDEIVRDFWRGGSANAATARLLVDTWGSPGKLANQVCDSRWRGRKTHVASPDFAALRAACERARATIAVWNDEALEKAATALRSCIEHPPTLKQRVDALATLRAWAKGGEHGDAADATALKQARSLGAKALDGVKPKGIHAEGEAIDDLKSLCTAHAALLQADADQGQVPSARLLRDARLYLETELPRRLAGRNLMGHDQAVDRLAEALSDGERGRRAAERIRSRWKAALIDEFQDTDRRQWDVVHTLFGASTLVLVGDPKQAIYGFRGGDVFAWLEAREHAEGEPLRLLESRRAGDGLCKAINALFSTPKAFIEAGIEHPDLRPASTVKQCALLRDGKELPALELWWLDPETVGHAANRPVPSKAYARRAIERACVGWIARMLQDDHVRLRDKQDKLHALKPKHIAVLVNANAEAHALQAALGSAGVPASCNLRASVYASDEAADLALLLDALVAPDDLRRARAGRASLLVGDDAISIADSRDDEVCQARMLEGMAAWAAEVRRQGPMPWLHRLVATAAPRLLATPAGERRVANYLQLAELLQNLDATSFGAEDLATRFARARVEATDDADSARLRLDTDANAVTISTVHAAKGLEYDVVLVPYAVLGRDPHRNRDARPPLHWYHDGNAPHVAIGAGADADVQARAILEIRAEDVRKFYVAVTRASALCVLPWGPVNQVEYTAAYYLLHAAGRDQSLRPDVAGCDSALVELCQRADQHARIVRELPAAAGPQPAPAKRGASLHAREFTRTTLERDWQTWSFSRLVRGSANRAAVDPLPGSGDADTLASANEAGYEPGLAGARFGTAVHAAFEDTDFNVWRDATGVPQSERGVIERGLRAQGLADSDAAMKRAVEVVGACIRGALNAPLPCGTNLCDVPPEQRKAEIEFHLTLSPARSADLYSLLHRHGYQQQRSGIAAPQLHGLLTGKIDLAFSHAGRFHIVDWKTNRCAPYDEAALRAEIAMHDYDLQWLVYTLALHRWLRQQVPDYDYDRHIGETYYLFVRGMTEGAGIHVDRPPRALIEGMDALFGSREADA